MEFGKRIRQELWPDHVTGVINCAAFIAGVVACTGAAESILSFVKAYAPDRVVAAYLWTSLAVHAASMSGLYVVYRALVVDRIKRREEYDAKVGANGWAMQLAHEMSERVRLACCKRGSYDCQADLQYALGEGIRRYLKLRLPGAREYSITVKQVVPGMSQLRAVFRDQGQDEKVRKRGEVEALDESYIYKRFEIGDGAGELRRWVLVRDTQQVDKDYGKAIRARAGERKYRSSMAFPIRVPVENGGSTTVSVLRGFLSVDCPHPNAFDGLFQLLPDHATPGNHGEGFEADEDMNLFFGLADSVATIFMLLEPTLAERAHTEVRP